MFLKGLRNVRSGMLLPGNLCTGEIGIMICMRGTCVLAGIYGLISFFKLCPDRELYASLTGAMLEVVSI